MLPKSRINFIYNNTLNLTPIIAVEVWKGSLVDVVWMGRLVYVVWKGRLVDVVLFIN
jgi:hypothetical protein